MISLLYTWMIIFMLLTLMTLMLNLFSKKMFHDREKSSPFECGFEPKTSARLPFSLQFFLIAVIFIIFDIEIALLLPMIPSMKISNIFVMTMTFMFFILILLGGLMHEWKQGALDWTK